MKKVIKFLPVVIVCAFFMALFMARPVSANFDSKKNKINLSVEAIDDEGVKKIGINVSIKYQRGFNPSETKYMICLKHEGDVIETPESCKAADIKVDWKTIVSGNPSDYISKEDASIADEKTTIKDFKINTGITMDEKNVTYVVFVKTSFCSIRNIEDGYNTCTYWHQPDAGEKLYTKGEITVSGNGKLGFEIEDEEVKELVDKILEIVRDIVLPVIYAIIGVFFVIKGAILGIKIVKSADEPQVRQEKIHSLKWLIIGVAITFGVAGSAHVVISIITGVLKF